MPPKVKYTKEQIGDAAYELVRQKGIENLSARNLAAFLGTSTAPIFTAFTGIEEVQNAVYHRAWELYCSYITRGLEMELSFKGTGLMYIRFAGDEPNLFKMLFMSSQGKKPPSHYFPAGDSNEPRIRDNVEKNYGLSTEKAKKLYNHLSVYTHGIAVMKAQGNCVFTDDDISEMLSEMYRSLVNGGEL